MESPVVEVMIPDEVFRAGEQAMKIYCDSILNGCTTRMAEMFAMRQAPRGMTDSTFMNGMKRLGDTHNPMDLKDLVKAAKRHGYTPNPNDAYMPGLARFRGDPEAFVSHKDGVGYIRKLAEKRGTGCEGVVNVKSREPIEPPRPKHRLAPDIVERGVQAMRKENPELKRVPTQELREQIIETHGQKV